MIRAVGNKRLSLTNEEFCVYNKIAESVGKEEFIGTFETDNNGMILSVISARKVDDVVIQFLFNIMHNQRLREQYKIFVNLEERISDLELSIKKLEKSK